MAAFGLSKLPFFSSRRSDDGDARFEDTAPDAKTGKKKGLPLLGKAEQVPELAPPVVGKREKQIDGQAIRRPVSGAAALEGGFLSLAGIREHYMAEEPEIGRYVIRNIETGKDVVISGIDYVQFADLTVSCAFLTRSNPESLVLPTPAQALGTQGNIHDLTKEVAAAIDEGMLAGDTGAHETEAAQNDVEASPKTEALAAAPQSDAEADASIAHAGAAPEPVTVTEAELLAGAGDEAASLSILDIACRQEGRIVDNGDRSWTFHPTGAFNGEVTLALTIRDAAGEESCVEAILTIEADDNQDDTEIADREAGAQTVAPESVTPWFADRADDTATEVAEAAQEAPEPSAVGAEPAAPLDSDAPVPVEAPVSLEPPVFVEAPPVAPTASRQDPEQQPPAPQDPPAQNQSEDLIVKVSELIGEDFEGQDVRLHDFTQPDNGRLVDNGDGTLSFTPNPGWDGSTTFTYSVIDEAGKITSCTLIVELDPEDAPESPALEGAPGNGAVPDVDLYAGAHYEDIAVDEEDRPIGPGAEEMTALLRGAADTGDDIAACDEAANDEAASDQTQAAVRQTPASEILAGLKTDSKDRPLESAAETPKKPKKRSKNAEAAEALFKQLDW